MFTSREVSRIAMLGVMENAERVGRVGKPIHIWSWQQGAGVYVKS